MAAMSQQPVLLIIRDGWGENHNPDHDAYNAVKLSNSPVADRLTNEWPRTEIRACGLDVGLPDGVMGNSEVGHQNIGAGRIVDQELVRIDKAIESGDVRQREVLQKALEKVRAGGKLHLMGITSDAGVHGMLEHLYGLLKIAKDEGLGQSDVLLHAFTDGRDTSPDSGKGYIEQVEAKMAEIGVGKIASVCGRFWSMDRDKRWERVQSAYDMLVGAKVERTASSAAEAVQAYYDKPLDAQRKGDEFVLPTQIIGADGAPVGTIQDGDAVLFYNYRGDRPRELTRAFIDDNFEGWERGKKLDIYFITMTQYEKGLCPNILFPKPPKMPKILGAYLEELGIKQFRTAETEKFPHVTFFFNDYREEPFEGEDRAIIQSPKDVSTYDQKPEMSARGVCDAAKEAILSGEYGLIVVNFANPDMVGHTGVIEAAVKACEFVDGCVGELLEAIDQVDGRALITADHGNSDQLFIPEKGSPHTAHTLNPVEAVVYGRGLKGKALKDGGRLADVAPTLLKLMELEQPVEMTGECLLA